MGKEWILVMTTAAGIGATGKSQMNASAHAARLELDTLGVGVGETKTAAEGWSRIVPGSQMSMKLNTRSRTVETMRLHLFALISAALLGLAQPAAFANDIEPDKEFYTAELAQRAIFVDGKLDEWSGVPVLSDPKFAIPKGSGTGGTYVLFEPYAGGTWSGPDDHTSAVQIVYDQDNVYFGFVVTDDYHENAARSPWNGDSVQLMIANPTRSVVVALYNYALGGVEGNLGQVIVDHELSPNASRTEAVVTRDAAAKKTYYEIKLPASAVGLKTPLRAGTQFGLGMIINDSDDGPGQRGQRGWGGLGAHALVFGKTPSETALITLGVDETTLQVLGVGVASLEGGDMTDPDNNGVDALGAATHPSWAWKSIRSSHEPDFEGGENSFNIFDNQVGGGNDKWCCDDPTPGNPVWVAVEFSVPVNLTHFTVTSGNDSPGRDPVNWAIQGSNDGVNYTDIYHLVANPAPWTARNQVIRFKLPRPAPLYRFIRYIAYDTPANEHQLNEVEYFGIVGGPDRLVLSALEGTSTKFTFRSTDVRGSIIDPSTVKISIDGQAKTPVRAIKRGAVTDFTYTYPGPLTPSAQHTYAVEVKDTIGNTVMAKGEFTLPTAFFPTADLPSPKVVNKGWAIRHIFGAGTISDIPSALAQIQRVGKPGFTGVAIDYTSEVINYNAGGLFAKDLRFPDAVTKNAAWTGQDFIQFGVANLEIPEDSSYTFGVHTDDGFAMRIRGGEADAVFGNGQLDPLDPEAVIHPANTGDSSTRGVYRLKKGVYRIEFLWWDRDGDDNGEIYAVKGRFAADADTDQWKLVGDNNPSKTFVRLGVDASGWTVTSSDPGNPPTQSGIISWADAVVAHGTTGGGAQNYNALNIGDPETNGGVLPFPKNTSADDNDFVLRATAKLVVPMDGDYLLGFDSDDGAYMTVRGQTFIELVRNVTGSSLISADSVVCDVLTGQSATTARIFLRKGTYDMIVGMFEREGGAFLRVTGGQWGAPLGSLLTKNGAGVFVTAEALQATDKPVGILATGITNFRIVDLGRTGKIRILFDGTGVIQSSTKVASGYTDTAIKSGDEVATLGASQFFRVKP